MITIMDYDKWIAGSIDYDIFIYGMCCTPCLYGENAYSVTRHPSCVSYALSYALLAMSFNMLGSCVGNALMPENPYMILACSSFFSSIGVGYFAGKNRQEMWQMRKIFSFVSLFLIVFSQCNSGIRSTSMLSAIL